MPVDASMTPPKRRGGFTEAQKIELTLIIDAAVKAAVAPAVRQELKDAGLRVDGDANQNSADADFKFLRKVRLWFEGGSAKVGGAIILSAVGGIAWLLMIGAQAFFNNKP
jgi:hypothetical protein